MITAGYSACFMKMATQANLIFSYTSGPVFHTCKSCYGKKVGMIIITVIMQCTVIVCNQSLIRKEKNVSFFHIQKADQDSCNQVLPKTYGDRKL